MPSLRFRTLSGAVMAAHALALAPSMALASDEPCPLVWCGQKQPEAPPPVTAEARALWQAAEQLDEAQFMQLIDKVDSLEQYSLNNRPLLFILLSQPKLLTMLDEADTPAERDAIVSAHRASLPVRERMMAAAIAAGADIHATSYLEPRPLLQAALLYGSPHIVSLLLARAAATEQDGNDAFDEALAAVLGPGGAVTSPAVASLVTLRERTDMLTQVLRRPRVPASGPEPFSLAELSVLVATTEGTQAIDAFLAAYPGVVQSHTDDETWPSPLTLAAFKGDHAAVELLGKRLHLTAPSNAREPASSWVTDAALAAAAGGHMALAKSLLPAHAWVDQAGPVRMKGLVVNGRTVEIEPVPMLHYAAVAGDTDWTKQLIAQGAKPDGARLDKTTTLNEVFARQHDAVAELMLRHGADAMLSSIWGPSPMLAAAQAGKLGRLELIAAHRGGCLAARSPDELLDLAQALAKSSLGSVDEQSALVEVLRRAGLEPAKVSGRLPSIFIAKRKPLVARWLLSNGAPMVLTRRETREEPENGHIDPALTAAIDVEDEGTVQLLLDRGADVHLPCRGGVRPLGSALMKGNAAIMERLVAAGAQLKKSFKRPHEALVHAIASGQADLVDRVTALGGGKLSTLCPVQMGYLQSILLSEPAFLAALEERGLPLGRRCGKDRFNDKLVTVHLAQETTLTPEQSAHLVANLKAHPELLDARALIEGHRVRMLDAAIGYMRDDLVAALLAAGVQPDQEAAWTAIEAGQPHLLRQLLTHGLALSERLPNGLTLGSHIQCRENPTFRAVLGLADDASECTHVPNAEMTGAELAKARRHAGSYRLTSSRTVSSTLVLHPNGRFDFTFKASSRPQIASGTWRLDGPRLLLDSGMPREGGFFRIAATRRDAAASGVTLRVLDYEHMSKQVDVFDPASGAVLPYRPAPDSDDVAALPWTHAPATLYIRHRYLNNGQWFALPVPLPTEGAPPNQIDVAWDNEADAPYRLKAAGVFSGAHLAMRLDGLGHLRYRKR
ncbi:MAG: ankyrin repeat domain-containing protein [Gammaproteobacteria bacterium]